MAEAIDKAISLLNQEEAPVVAVVGSLSRTSWDDIDMIGVVLDMLKQHTAATYLNGARKGFDYHLLQVAEMLELCMCTSEPETDDIGKEYRDPFPMQHASVLLAFPAEVYGSKKRFPIETADELVVGNCLHVGCPVLAVYRDGTTYWRTK